MRDGSLTFQGALDKFWTANLGHGRPPRQPFSVLPRNTHAKLDRRRTPKGNLLGGSVADSYLEAVSECEFKVAQIVADCKRNNIKYSDPDFNLSDFRHCINPLGVPKQDNDNDEGSVISIHDERDFPACVKRVGDVFEEPKFYAGNGPKVHSTRQGAYGDCWFISALGSLCVGEKDPLLIQKICPVNARDEKVGVYGFVFYRDGEWFSEIIDDKLYLSFPNYDDWKEKGKSMWSASKSRLPAQIRRDEFLNTYQRNSQALHYGSSTDPNETWVPLLEKAYAKAHGDYGSIRAGRQGEGVEDLTGGVSTAILTADVLDIDELWTGGLMEVNKEFLFGAGTREAWNPSPVDLQGIKHNHSYCVLKAVEYEGQRLVQLKDPWGNGGWTGPWSDGSNEWTADALKDLEHRFDNNGIFWMPYKLFLQRFACLSRTRLFSNEWNISQRWAIIQVPWSGECNDTKFEFVLPQATPAVIVLSKLDERYFVGLEGPYDFTLAFRVYGSGKENYLIQGHNTYERSASAELDLEAGVYEVFLQIHATRLDEKPKVEDVVKENWLTRRKKLVRIGMSHDIAHYAAQSQSADTTTDFEFVDTANQPRAMSEASAMGNTPADSEAYDVKMEVTERATQETQHFGGQLYAIDNDVDISRVPSASPPPSHTYRERRSVRRVSSRASLNGDEPPGPRKHPGPAEPWDAICTIGLRIFCHKTAATIRAISQGRNNVRSTANLDIDDPEEYARRPKTRPRPRPTARRRDLSGWNDVGALLG